MTLLRWLARLFGISIGRKRVESRGTPATTAYEHGVGDLIFGGRRRDDPPLPFPPPRHRTAGDILDEKKRLTAAPEPPNHNKDKP